MIELFCDKEKLGEVALESIYPRIGEEIFKAGKTYQVRQIIHVLDDDQLGKITSLIVTCICVDALH